jgi:hypothetical protein
MLNLLSPTRNNGYGCETMGNVMAYWKSVKNPDERKMRLLLFFILAENGDRNALMGQQ